MDSVEIVGFLAGFIMVFSFLPQLIKTYKTKRTQDISIFMLILQIICISLWMTYGLLINSQSLIITNAISLVIVVSIFIMKIKFDKKENTV